MDDPRGCGKAQGLDLLHALLIEGVVELDTGRVGLEFLRGDDDDAAVSRAQVEHFLAGLKATQPEHLFDDDFRRGIVGRKLFSGFVLREYRQRKEAKTENSHHVQYTPGSVLRVGSGRWRRRAPA